MFGGALAWAQFKLRGGVRNVGMTTGAYAAVVATAILLLSRSNPRHQTDILNGCTQALAIFQAGALLLIGGGAVRNAIRRDLASGMIQSHRLMPVSGAEGVTGYILGAVSQAVCIAVVNLVAGIFTTTSAGRSPTDWLLTNAVLAIFSIMAWTVIALLSFLTQAAVGLLLVFVILGFATGGLITLLLPALALLLAPGVSGLLMMGAPARASAVQVSIPAQLAVTAFCFVGAARKFRRDDVLAFSPLLGLALVAMWVAMTWVGITSMDRFLGGGAGMFGPGDMVPSHVQIIASSLVAVLVGILPVMGSAWLTTTYRRRRLLRDVALDSKPVPTGLMVLAVALIVCCLPVYLITSQMDATNTGWTPEMSRNLAFTAASIALHLLAISYLMRILYRVSNKCAILVAVFIFCFWVGPLGLDFLRFGATGMRPDDQIITGISACGPVGTMIALWGQFEAAVEPGLLVQAICTAILAALFHSTQQRSSLPEARAASLTLTTSNVTPSRAAPPEPRA